MPATQKSLRGFLRRLRKDASGNTLALLGAALIPLSAMIGSGVDMSRAYMAQTRLQSACDAASLAGRRLMTNDTMSTAVRNEATKYFNFNFPQGLYKSAAFTPTVTRPAAGVIRVQASTTIPTEIMRLYGFQTLPISVDCQASQNFVNTDIMLVLDTTGSMMCTPEESSQCGRTSEIGTSRIVALRDAVMALYDQLASVQTQLEANGMRLRYGIVPYSSAVNVGQLLRDRANTLGQPRNSYLRTSAYYQTRRVRAVTTLTSSQCTNAPYYGNYSSGTCRYYIYEQGDPIDTTNFLNGNTVNLTPLIGGSTPSSTAAVNSPAWTGCIEERQSVNTITSSSGYSIPTGAHDLNIDEIPDSDTNRWVPHWPEVEYNRGAGTSSQNKGQNSYYNESNGNDQTSVKSRGQAYYACPTAARRLNAFTRADLQTAVNGLQAIGGTYHDIGMIWGGRMISAAGVFSDSPNTFNGMPVAKHIIFMTDGQMAPNADTYTSYGVENLDNRIGSYNATEQTSRHTQRFKMICNAIKNKNVSIWVIAFSTTAGSDLIECASSANQVSTVSDRNALIAKFTEIGKNIGTLRLTQ